MNTIPTSSRISPMRPGVSSIFTPRASSTSALPHFDVNERLPCLAMRTPAPAATSAAAVEMLNVVTSPPPVPAVSTSVSGYEARTGTMARRMARTAPATSAGASPFPRRPTRTADICTGVAVPSMNRSNADSASSALRSSPPVSFPRRVGMCTAGRVEVWVMGQRYRAGGERGNPKGARSRIGLNRTLLACTFLACRPGRKSASRSPFITMAARSSAGSRSGRSEPCKVRWRPPSSGSPARAGS